MLSCVEGHTWSEILEQLNSVQSLHDQQRVLCRQSMHAVYDQHCSPGYQSTLHITTVVRPHHHTDMISSKGPTQNNFYYLKNNIQHRACIAALIAKQPMLVPITHISHLSDYFQHVACSNRRRLRSSSSSLLLIRRTRLITVGDRAFPVAGSRLWSSLPHVVTSAPTLAVFWKRLETYLFSRSFAL